jgi:filamentous hemagglutinin
LLKVFNSFIALFVSSLLILQPFVANADGIVVDQAAAAANRATMDAAQNGVPVVNIVAPTAGGVSHNKFGEFSVDSRGVIMNNSLVLGVSQLGGALVGNPNFTGGRSARIILNEVTGSNRSTLNGATEIFGDRAAYVLANPNGITCNGCGFINTPRVTLSTGTPQMSGGNLTGFDVNGGDVLFEGLDVNATGVDSFDIITRTAKFTAALHAGEINVITGRNSVDYATKVATIKADDGSAKPAVAIDSSALGGMYAGKINLVSTEAGVGVKTDGKLAASASDVVITADGRIEYKEVNAAKNIKVTSKNNSIKQVGNSYSGENTELKAKGAIELQDGFTAAAKDVNFDTEDDIRIDNFSMVLSGVNANYLGNDVTFSDNGNGSVTFNAGGNVTNNGFISAAKTLTLNTSNLFNPGLIQSGSDMELTTSYLDNSNTYITDVNGNITNGIVAGGKLSVSGNLNNNNGAIVSSGLSLTSDYLDNADGLVYSVGDLAIDTDDVNNTNGVIYAFGDSKITTGNSFNNTAGLLSSFGNMVIEAGTQVNNYLGTIYSGGDLTAKNMNNNNGIIQTEGNIVIDNSGNVLDNNLGNIRALGNIASISISGLTDLLNLGGNIIAQANIDINIAGDYVINGNIATNDHIDITASSVTNNANVQADDFITLTLNQGGFTNNSGAVLLSNTSVTIDALNGNVVNDGEISGPIIDITAANGGLTNSASGVISSSGTLDIAVLNSISNAGKINSLAATTIGAGTLSNTGQIASDTILTITTTGNSIHNTAGGLLYATSHLTLHTTDLENINSDILSETGNITIDKAAGVKNTSVTNTSGTIEALAGNIRIDTQKLTNNSNETLPSVYVPSPMAYNSTVLNNAEDPNPATPAIETIYVGDPAFTHDEYWLFGVTGGPLTDVGTIAAGNDILINSDTF